MQSVKIEAKEAIRAHSGGTIENVVVHDEREDESYEHRDGGFWGNDSETQRQSYSRQVRANKFKAGREIVMASRGLNLQQAPVFQSVEPVTLSSGEKVHIATALSSNGESVSRESESLVWQSAKQFGHNQQDAVLMQSSGPVEIRSGQVEVEVPVSEDVHGFGASKLDRTIGKLAGNPGTAWLGQLYDDARISPAWTEITARHDRWHKKQEGLTGAAAALIAVAVAVATGGVGAGLIGAAGAAGAMASAGFSAMASTAAVSVVNNQGNIGRVFKDLASKDSLKKLAVSVITAGMLSSAGLMSGAADGAKSSVQEVVQERAHQSLFNLETLTHHLKCNLVRGGVQAAADVVTGDKIDGLDLLKNAATNTIVDALGEHLAQEIGQDYKVGKINPLQHKLLHAGVGGFAGALMNPADPLHGAASGAIGAFVAETAADHLMGQTAASTMARYLEDCRRTGEVPTENGYYNQMVSAMAGHPKLQMMVPSSDHARAKERVAMIAKIVGVAGAFLAGLDPNIAFRAAENAIENNFLLPVFLRNNDPAMLADSEEWMAEHIKNQAETEEVMAAVGDVALEVGLAGLQKLPVVGPIVGATKGFLKKGAGAARMAAKSAAKKAAGNPAVQVKSAPVKAAKPVKAEQPWVVREGQEWKEKIVGRAQKTGTPGHSVRSYREAIKASKKDDVERVFLDRGYNRATGQKIKSNRRPDVIIKTKDGKVHPREVPSKSDDVKILRTRNKEALDKLPKHNRGKYEQIDITKIGGE